MVFLLVLCIWFAHARAMQSTAVTSIDKTLLFLQLHFFSHVCFLSPLPVPLAVISKVYLLVLKPFCWELQVTCAIQRQT